MPEKKLPYPKGAYFIIAYKYLVGFCVATTKLTMVLYFMQELNYNSNKSTSLYHFGIMAIGLAPIGGAIIADSLLGRYKTMVIGMAIVITGVTFLFSGSLTTFESVREWFTFIAAILMAIGGGLILPNVDAFGADQFKLPEQQEELDKLFPIYYFCISSAWLLASITAPILRVDVSCNEHIECYPLPFGLILLVELTAAIIFLSGSRYYVYKLPEMNMFTFVCKTISHALYRKFFDKSAQKRKHWLDYADDKYDKQLIHDTKAWLRIVLLYMPLPAFWSLYDQQVSLFTIQALSMNGDIGFYTIKPEQITMFNPCIVVSLVFIIEFLIYPRWSTRPLRKIAFGGFCTSLSFIIAGILEIQLQKTNPPDLAANQVAVRVYNGELCQLIFQSNHPALSTLAIEPLSYAGSNYTQFDSDSFQLNFSVTSQTNISCFGTHRNEFELKNGVSFGLFAIKNELELEFFQDNVSKPINGHPRVRMLANLYLNKEIIWHDYKGRTTRKIDSSNRSLFDIRYGKYDVLIEGTKAMSINCKSGGFYVVLVHEREDGTYKCKTLTLVEPNSVHILWLLPQIVCLAFGEVLILVTTIRFNYTEAPLSMKSMVASVFLITYSVGNFMTATITGLMLFTYKENEIFLFALIMITMTSVFITIAYYYQPNNPTQSVNE